MRSSRAGKAPASRDPVGVSLLTALVVSGAAFIGACGSKGPGGFPGGGAQPVTVVTLKTQPLTLTRELPGRTTAYLVADVRPQANGIVKERLFAEGGMVRAGQTLYQLDDSLYRAQHDSNVAALAKTQAALEVTRNAAQRSDQLVKIHAVSAQDNENAIAALRQAEADAAAAKAAVDSSSVNLAYTRISAPISGRIGKSSVTRGALVVANQSAALATVQQLDPIYVEVTQASSEWLQLKKDIDSGRLQGGGAGTTVAIVLEDGRRYQRDGQLQFADISVDPNTGSFALRAIVPNPDNTLLPGMYVKAVLDEGVRAEALLAPQPGITRDPRGNATALVVGTDSKVEQRQVTVSRTIGDQWLVEDGLKPGDRVIIEGLQKVRPGAAVQPSEAGTTPPGPPTGPGVKR
jgi:membrane fusion protein (multidrug efflux system)